MHLNFLFVEACPELTPPEPIGDLDLLIAVRESTREDIKWSLYPLSIRVSLTRMSPTIFVPNTVFEALSEKGMEGCCESGDECIRKE